MFRVSCILGVFLVTLSPLWAASIYVYVDQQGNKLITDHPRNDLAGYTFVKNYGVDDYFGLADRPSGSSTSRTRPLTPIASRYDDLIISQANKIGLEPALLKAIVHIESSFNPEAISPKGAQGLMQLMPETAKRYGVSSRSDPVESMRVGEGIYGIFLPCSISTWNWHLQRTMPGRMQSSNSTAYPLSRRHSPTWTT